MSRARRNRRNARPQRRSEPRQPRPWRWKSALDPTRYGLIAVLVGVATLRLVLLSDEAAPPGADPGNWLAFTESLFGTQVKAAESVYFPVTLFALKGLLTVMPSLMATKVLGVTASVLMGIPFYLILRRGCSRLLASGLTLVFLLTGYQEEVLAFGGYPQLLATTFLLFTIYWLGDGLLSGSRRALLLAAGATALVAGTHHFTLLAMAPTLLILGFALFVLERPNIRAFVRNVGVWATAAAFFAAVFLPWYAAFFSLMEGNPANPGDFSVLDMGSVTSYVFSENRPLWLALLVVAGILPLVPSLGERAARIRPSALALLAGPLLFFAVTSEVRTFQLIETGVIMSLALAAAAVEQHLSQTRVRVTVQQMERVSLGLATAALLIVIASSGHERFTNQRVSYQIVDDSALEALVWLRERTPPDALVVANESISRVSYAWWVEGFAQRPTYSLIQPQYLSFAEEKEQSAIARRLLARETPPDEVEALLEETGIEYIFLDKRSGGKFKPLLSKVTFYVSFENDHFGILRYPEASARANP